MERSMDSRWSKRGLRFDQDATSGTQYFSRLRRAEYVPRATREEAVVILTIVFTCGCEEELK
jgi:hypothetical protein